MMENILGISLGTRLLGMAVLYDGELCDYRVRTFYGAWTQAKRNDMIATLKKTIERYGVTMLSVKTPKPAHCSQSIHELIADIWQLSTELGIKLSVCTISVLKGQFNGQGGGNKQALIQAIIAKYPHHRQLAELYSKERNNHSAYYVKLFEAIACTELV